MNDYESQYEEYKNTLLHSIGLRNDLNDLYTNTQHLDSDYLDHDGALSKIGVSSAGGGVCYALCFSLVQLNEFPGILVRVILAIVGTLCFFGAAYFGSQFKKDFAKRNFRMYQYERCVESWVQRDKELEAKQLVRDFLSRQIGREELTNRYDALSRYDRFAEDLTSDYIFEEELL